MGQEQGERVGIDVFFFSFWGGVVWSGPQGPPLQGHNAIKHSVVMCLIEDDKEEGAEREGTKKGCSQDVEMKFEAAA